MDSRTAAHVLSRIAVYLQLRGESSFKARAYAGAAREIRALGADDLAPLYRTGALGRIRGLGPATLSVIGDLVETGESRYLQELESAIPAGLVDMLGVRGLRAPRIRQIHEALGIESIEELEAAAVDGRLARVPKIGPKTVQRILEGIAAARARGTLRLYHHVMADARTILAGVREHPDVTRAEIAGALRRRLEVADRIDIVAECSGDPVAVAPSFARLPGSRAATAAGARADVEFIDGAHLSVWCASTDAFGLTLWRATGSDEHVAEVVERLAERGAVDGDGEPHVAGGADEHAIYGAAGLAFIEPELRENLGEIDAAARGGLPSLVEPRDILGALHCHTHYSDGTASIADMVNGARARGWRYLGITDHSQSAFYAGGMTREKLLAQHEEIDRINADQNDVRVLKGVEADILQDGRLDYDAETLDQFDFVVGSVHSRFAMDGPAMTERVLRALDDPHLTILGHPTGRILLSREPYAIDLDAVIEKAAHVGAALELNCDPRRMDLDWRIVHRARARGVTIAIGPDAHSVAALDNVSLGVGFGRKAWLEARDVLNARSADEVLQFARARRR